jgi:hypothetical protein
VLRILPALQPIINDCYENTSPGNRFGLPQILIFSERNAPMGGELTD